MTCPSHLDLALTCLLGLALLCLLVPTWACLLRLASIFLRVPSVNSSNYHLQVSVKTDDYSTPTASTIVIPRKSHPKYTRKISLNETVIFIAIGHLTRALLNSIGPRVTLGLAGHLGRASTVSAPGAACTAATWHWLVCILVDHFSTIA